MTNREIAAAFRELGQLMELHGEAVYRTRSYSNAYRQLRGLEPPLADMSKDQLLEIKGVGAAIAAKIQELTSGGRMTALEKYRDKTPAGVRDMLSIKGFGPKKIWTVWQDLGVESVGELLYACNENRLVDLKGFGPKTQDDIRQKLEFFQRSAGQYRYADVEAAADGFLATLKESFPTSKVETSGAYRRCCPVVERVDVLMSGPTAMLEKAAQYLTEPSITDGRLSGTTTEGVPVQVQLAPPEDFGRQLFLRTAAPEFLTAFEGKYSTILQQQFREEADLFAAAKLPFIAPELRESAWALDLAEQGALPKLIELSDIKGVVHAHTTYSDGGASLADMAAASAKKGYEYLTITDHSKVAVYANGLSEARILQQWAEIDAYNQQSGDFRVLKGTECDILADGRMDYSDELLSGFDIVIASIHSGLKMDEQKATNRLLRAIEHPNVHMLGHPTGRLLLSREGYPVDHKTIIDACAAEQVAIEINANPMRLDMDWTWLPYALEKGVQISINPDAHSIGGIDDIRYGVLAARKGGLTAAQCLNTRPVADFLAGLTTR